MAGEIRKIPAEQVPQLLPDFGSAEREIILQAAANSNPLWAGLWDGDPLCILGLIPPSLLSETAYLWLASTPAASKHKVIFGRWAKRLVPIMTAIYPSIVGHCLTASAQHWLRSLGAKLDIRLDSTATFEISSWQQH